MKNDRLLLPLLQGVSIEKPRNCISNDSTGNVAYYFLALGTKRRENPYLMNLSIQNAQKICSIHMPALRRLTIALMKCACGQTDFKKWTISLVLTDDSSIGPVNKIHLSRSGTTDVISFKYDGVPGEPEGPAGEIFVNVERALEEGHARRTISHSWDEAHELALYVAHGLDHLTGGRDRTRTQRARMVTREKSWVGMADYLGLVDGLIRKGPMAKG